MDRVMLKTVAAETGERIRAARLLAGLNQAELAEAVGIDHSAISRVELGVRKVTLAEAAGVAKVCGVSLDYLAGVRPLAGGPMARNGTGLAEDFF